MAEVGAVSAPMEWFQAAQPSQSLSGHGPLHRMKAACGGRSSWSHDEHGARRHGSIRVAQVPGDQIVFSVDVAGGAGNDACPGKFCIIQKAAALPNYSRRGIEAADRQLAFENVRTEIH